MNKYETTLELNVILDKCKEEAFLEVSKQNIIDLQPINDIDLLNDKLNEAVLSIIPVMIIMIVYLRLMFLIM